ncbi:MAG: DUF721 domain-containing protein [Betaproteobacteria bacterium]|nr:DUF721 domain-containing protein [Betaproteobacteria bacterium]
MRAHLGEFLLHNDETNSLISHANFLLDLRRVVVHVLPGEIAQKCSIANYKDGRLIIFADNNAVAAKLRLLAGGLPRRLSGLLLQTGRQVTAVEIEVQPRNSLTTGSKKSATLSKESAKEILDLSTQVVDIKLKNALISLASKAAK